MLAVWHISQGRKPGTSNGVALQWTGGRCSVHPMYTNATPRYCPYKRARSSLLSPRRVKGCPGVLSRPAASALEPTDGFGPGGYRRHGHSDVCGGTERRCRRDTDAGRELGAVLDSQDTGNGWVYAHRSQDNGAVTGALNALGLEHPGDVINRAQLVHA